MRAEAIYWEPRDTAYCWISSFICSCVRADARSSLTLSLKKATRSTVRKSEISTTERGLCDRMKLLYVGVI